MKGPHFVNRSRGTALLGLAAIVAACTTSTLDLHGPGTPTPGSTPFGSGSDGDLVLAPGESRAVNGCFALSRTSGTQVVLQGTAALAAGARLLLLQVQDTVATSADATPISTTGQLGEAGLWQLVDAVALSSSGSSIVVGVTPSPSAAFSSAGGRVAQACTVPQFQNVTVPASATLHATPWDGRIGGVLAFYAETAATVDGSAEASRAGFRGGVPRTLSNSQSITAPDTTGGDGGGKGESVDPKAWTHSGRGNYANGGGGGNAHNGGGGGGGLGGRGGSGGRQQSDLGMNPLTAGMGGVAVTLPATDRLILGGGGGAGQQNDGVAGAGGVGGGLVLIFARSVSGSGTLASDGAPGADAGAAPTTNYPDGAGGGGSGGLVWVTAETSTFAGSLSAQGGAGGSTVYLGNNAAIGPGGGGGGGHLVAGGLAFSTTAVTAGTAGHFTGMSVTTANGASAGAAGIVTP